jgi:tRNA(Met) C34 N-acetyltransferase TmcA
MATHEPVPFSVRLAHTIRLLRWETDQGIEDWTDTLVALEAVLSEVSEEQTHNEPAEMAEESDDWDDDPM